MEKERNKEIKKKIDKKRKKKRKEKRTKEKKDCMVITHNLKIKKLSAVVSFL